MKLDEKTWTLFARSIASPGAPEDYNYEAVQRLMKRLEPYIVRVKGVKSQFKAHNLCILLPFQSQADREYYEKAEERYLTEKNKVENSDTMSAGEKAIMILVLFLIYRMAAEYVKAPLLAKCMWEAVNKHGKAAVCATNFRPTITRAVEILINDYNIPRDMISLIWGGAVVKQTKKGDLKKQIMEADGLLELMKERGLDLKSLGLADTIVKEEKHFDPKLRMGAQNRAQRQEEIDRFQRGQSLYCFFTFKAGGVGLSLHHTDEHFKGTDKYCRRKESGYVYEEDIPKVPTRPREVFTTPTYSAIEVVQALGRCPRLTSLSDTVQTIICLLGTIETRVKYIMDAKLKCLTAVVKQHEDWVDAMTTRSGDVDKVVNRLIDTTKPDDEEDDGLIGGNVESDDE